MGFLHALKKRGTVLSSGSRANPLTPAVVAGIAKVVDFSLIIVATCTVLPFEQRLARLDSDIYALLFTAALSLFFFQGGRLYGIDSNARRTSSVLKALALFLLAAVLAHLPQLAFHDWQNPGWEMMTAVPALALVTWRTLFVFWLNHRDTTVNFRQRVAVIGAGEHGQKLVARLVTQAEQIEIIGIFDDRSDRAPKQIEGIPVRGNIDFFIEIARTTHIDRIIIALPRGAEQRLAGWLKRLSILPVRLDYCPGTPFAELGSGRASLGALPLVQMVAKPLDGWAGVIKTIEDRLLASILLLFALPLMAFIALAVRLTSPGPVIFRQRRCGFNNNVFEVLKFRTMQDGADSIRQAERGDPRVTRFGRTLRESSLDELPQLWNVIRGDMSLVGPRPHAVAHNEHYAPLIDAYLGRHRVKPGITGWAQVKGLRGETRTLGQMAARVEHDLYYIEHWSLWLDLRILARTLVVGFRHPRAY